LGSFTKERQRAEGRGQKEENIIFALCHSWFKTPKFIYEKKKKYVRSRRAALLNTTSLLNKSAFIYGVSISA
jgi:hypothetical protein